MVLIQVKKDFKNYYTSEDGEKMFALICKQLSKGEKVVVSFEGISSVNSSFVNSAFISLLDEFTFDQIREKLKFVNTNKQMNTLIINRFKFEISQKKSKLIKSPVFM